MKLDFSEVKANTIVPEGKAHLTISGAKEQTSQNGTHMLVLDMHDADGNFVRDNVCLEGEGAFRAQQLLKALKIDTEQAEGMEAADFIGMEVDAEVIHETYQEEDRSKVKKYILIAAAQ